MFYPVKLLLLSIFLLVGHDLMAANFQQPKRWHDSQISQLLTEGKVLQLTPMQQVLAAQGKKVEFDGQVFLATLENGLTAVFKVSDPKEGRDAHAEVAAYKASTILGFPYVPPTVLRTINGAWGSLQLYIKTSCDLLAPGEYGRALQAFSTDDWANLKIFYFVLGQWDTGPHNLLLLEDQGKSYPIAIDNSGIAGLQHVKYGELPFVRVAYSDKFNTQDFDQPFPFEQAETLDNPTAEALQARFGDRLPNSFYTGFTAYGQPLRFVVFRNSLWRQYHAFDSTFELSYTQYCPESSRAALEKLDLSLLKTIFSAAAGDDFLTENYLQAILERRDQLLQHVSLGSKALPLPGEAARLPK